MEKLIFALMIAAGLFPVVCSVKDYDWFFRHRKARFILKLFGRNGARIFYSILGILIIFFAWLAYVSGQIKI